MEAHVRSQPSEFSGAASVSVRGLADPLKLLLSVWYEFAHSGVDAGRVAKARSVGRRAAWAGGGPVKEERPRAGCPAVTVTLACDGCSWLFEWPKQ